MQNQDVKFSNRVPLILALVLLISTGFVYAADPPNVIQEIEFRGNENVETETIDYLVKTAIGSPVDYTTIRRDLKTLYATGRFDDIQVKMEPMDNGLKLVFIMKERPVITDVVITGAESISLNTLREELTVEKGKYYDPVTARQSASIIEEKYREKGFHFIQVTPRISGSDRSMAALIFDIDEGTKLKVKDVIIQGNNEISTGNRLWGLKSQVKENQEWWWFSFLTDDGIFREEMLADDVKAIEKYYKDRGFLRVTVDEPEMELNRSEVPDEPSTLTIKFNVDEGNVYRIGKVEVEVTDEEIIPEKDALHIIKSTRLENYQKFLGGSAFFTAGPRFEKGKRYSYALEEQAITNLADIYGAIGYIYAYVEPQRTIDNEKNTVDLLFKITEGEQTFLRRLEFRGNNRTRDRVLRRNFGIPEGGVFNTAQVKSSIARINYLAYIDEVVPEIVPQVDPTQIDVTIALSDNRQTEIQLSGGYSGYNKLYGTIGLSEHNLFGRGQELNLSATAGERSESFRFSFIDEWINDRPYYGSVGFWNTKEEYDYSNQKKRGGSVVGGRSFNYGFSTRLGYTYERNRVYDISENADDDVKDLEGVQITSSLTNSWIYNTLNDKLQPNKGFYGALSLELAGGALGGDNDFYKTKLSLSKYWSLPRKMVFVMKGEFNYANGLGGDELPFYERFRLGGPHSIRGFEDYSVGPQDEYGQSLGGNKAVELSAEVQIPIAQPLRLILFLDAGDAWAKEDRVDLRTLRPSTGFEVRFFMPGFGVPLRFIWGYNLDPYENENRNDFQFTMGTTF